MRAVSAVPLLAALAALPACTASQASYHLVRTEQAINRAQIYGADELAVYEYTMAVRYLEKAREENGYSDYGVAVELARISSEWADQAIISIDERGLKRREARSDTDAATEAPRPDYQVPRPGTTPGGSE